MPVYEFRCPADCGRFEARHPMASVPAAEPCPRCAAESSRMIAAVGLSRSGSAAHRAMEQAARSASEPEVVRGSPGRARSTPVTTDPRHRKLPAP